VSEHLERRFQELKFQVMIQEIVIRTLVRHLHEKVPALEIPSAFEEFLAETMLHLEKGIDPRLAEKAELYLKSFSPLANSR
jgi:hypothetical protein